MCCAYCACCECCACCASQGVHPEPFCYLLLKILLAIRFPYMYLLTPWGPGTWSPTRGGKCYPRWILQINREIENERKPKNQRFDLCFTMFFHIFTKSRIWSYGRYAHYGIRVRPTTRKKNMFTKKGISLKNSSLKLKVWLFKKTMIHDVRRFILSRYHIIWHIQHIFNI